MANEAVRRLGESRLPPDDFATITGLLAAARDYLESAWLSECFAPPMSTPTWHHLAAWCRLMQEWLRVYKGAREVRPRWVVAVKDVGLAASDPEWFYGVAALLKGDGDYKHVLTSFRESPFGLVAETAPGRITLLSAGGEIRGDTNPAALIAREAWEYMRRLPGVLKPERPIVADADSAIVALGSVVAWCEAHAEHSPQTKPPAQAQSEPHNLPAYLGMAVNEDDHTVTRNGVTVRFAANEKAWRVFMFLFDGRGRPRSLTDIYKELWNDSPVTPKAIQQQISVARNLLKPIGVAINSEATRYFLSAEKNSRFNNK